MSQCACGSKIEFTKCCEPIIAGKEKALTAGALMRARYTAYTTNDIDFIVNTTHADHREDMDIEEITNWSKKSTWKGLEIIDEQEGDEDSEWGMVEFKAKFKLADQDLTHHEKSDFEKIDGEWFFVDGTPVVSPQTRTSPKIGRNDPCACGSGKKFKKCCA